MPQLGFSPIPRAFFTEIATIGLRRRILLSFLGTLLLAGCAAASSIGDIGVFYNSTAPSSCTAVLEPICAANNAAGVLDGPVFVFVNTSNTDITNAMFTIVGTDFFDIGTIAANSSVTVIPGVSNDGLDHGDDNFFTHTGSIFDSSDEFPSLNTTEFELTGDQGSTQIESVDICGTIAAPVFTPACTAGPSNDGTVDNINFLGGPGNNDGPCDNCFGPAIVADLEPAVSAAPEPASFFLFGGALIGLSSGLSMRRKSRRSAK